MDAPEVERQVLGDPARLAVLRATGLLDAPTEAAFDRLATLAAKLLRTPLATVTLVEAGRQFYTACVGLPEPLAAARETPLDVSFCRLTVVEAALGTLGAGAAGGALAIPDTRVDPRTRAMASVTQLGVHAYAGVPLVIDGQPLGTLCVMDVSPRAWTADELEVLAALGHSVTAEVELRLANARLREAGVEAAATRDALQHAYDALQAERSELEHAHRQLQETAAELEAQTEVLQETAAHLEEQAAVADAARAAAEAAERQLQTVLAQAPAVVAVTVGPEHRFVLVNARAVAVVGRTDLVGRTYAEALPELEHQGYRALLDRVYATGEPFVAVEAPVRLDRPDGVSDARWYDFVYQPLRDPAGAVVGILQHAVDVTERVQARDAELERERQFRTLADAIPTLAWTARADGHIDWYNARWYAYTGTSPAGMEGWGWQSVHDPEALPWVLDTWRAGIASGEPVEMTFPLLGADGRFRRFLTRIVPVHDADGRVLRWFGTNTDVEAERAARDAALAAAARIDRLQALTAALAATVTVEDVAEVVVAQVASVTGARTAALLTRTAGSDEAVLLRQRGFDADTLTAYQRFPVTGPSSVALCLRTGDPVFVETRDGADGLLVRFPDVADGATRLGIHALATVPLTVAGTVIGAMAFTFDAPRAITAEDRAFFLSVGRQAGQALERARLLHAERAARGEAETANRAKSQFLSTMSHELRTPLNAIAGYTELLMMGVRGEPVRELHRQDMERIRRANQHLTALITDVLNFARVDAGQLQFHLAEVELTGIVADLEAMVGPQLAAKGLTFDHDAVCARHARPAASGAGRPREAAPDPPESRHQRGQVHRRRWACRARAARPMRRRAWSPARRGHGARDRPRRSSSASSSRSCRWTAIARTTVSRGSAWAWRSAGISRAAWAATSRSRVCSARGARSRSRCRPSPRDRPSVRARSVSVASLAPARSTVAVRRRAAALAATGEAGKRA